MGAAPSVPSDPDEWFDPVTAGLLKNPASMIPNDFDPVTQVRKVANYEPSIKLFGNGGGRHGGHYGSGNVNNGEFTLKPKQYKFGLSGENHEYSIGINNIFEDGANFGFTAKQWENFHGSGRTIRECLRSIKMNGACSDVCPSLVEQVMDNAKQLADEITKYVPGTDIDSGFFMTGELSIQIGTEFRPEAQFFEDHEGYYMCSSRVEIVLEGATIDIQAGVGVKLNRNWTPIDPLAIKLKAAIGGSVMGHKVNAKLVLRAEQSDRGLEHVRVQESARAVGFAAQPRFQPHAPSQQFSSGSQQFSSGFRGRALQSHFQPHAPSRRLWAQEEEWPPSELYLSALVESHAAKQRPCQPREVRSGKSTQPRTQPRTQSRAQPHTQSRAQSRTQSRAQPRTVSRSQLLQRPRQRSQRRFQSHFHPQFEPHAPSRELWAQEDEWRPSELLLSRAAKQ